jgi:hypothetical protein
MVWSCPLHRFDRLNRPGGARVLVVGGAVGHRSRPWNAAVISIPCGYSDFGFLLALLTRGHTRSDAEPAALSSGTGPRDDDASA